MRAARGSGAAGALLAVWGHPRLERWMQRLAEPAPRIVALVSILHDAGATAQSGGDGGAELIGTGAGVIGNDVEPAQPLPGRRVAHGVRQGSAWPLPGRSARSSAR